MRKTSLFLCLLFVSICVTQAQTWTSNQCTVELSGSVLRVYPSNGVSGAMQNFMLSGEGDYHNPLYRPWLSYACQIKKVIIEDGVTRIGMGSFADLGLDSIILGNRVMSIGYRAFYNLRPAACTPYMKPVYIYFKSTVPPAVIPHPSSGSTEVIYAVNSMGVDQTGKVTVPRGFLAVYLNSSWASQSYSIDKIGEEAPEVSLDRVYEYDASGNRTCRKVLFVSGGGSKSLFSSNSEEAEFPAQEEVVYTEQVGNLRLTVSPNPTTQMVTVRIENYSDFTGGNLRLYTMNGQLLQQHHVSSPEFTIDLSNYVQGVYLLKWQMNQHTDTWQIVKQ